MGRARGTAGKWARESGAHGADQWAWRGVVKGDARVGRARWRGPGDAALRAGRGGNGSRPARAGPGVWAPVWAARKVGCGRGLDWAEVGLGPG